MHNSLRSPGDRKARSTPQSRNPCKTIKSENNNYLAVISLLRKRPGLSGRPGSSVTKLNTTVKYFKIKKHGTYLSDFERYVPLIYNHISSSSGFESVTARISSDEGFLT